jgi:D-alanyl-lipoteichoic acid acyltransferase DltB (MBOAT superfamily)
MSWNPLYIILIIASTIVDYFAAIMIEKNLEHPNMKKKYLILSLAVNLGLLFTFKYLNFAIDTFNLFSTRTGAAFTLNNMNFLLPMGISFYTFQTLSYTVDVYRGRIKAERHLGYFALYVSFFPQLVAGPIERSSRLLPQLKKIQHFDYYRMREGLLQMGLGFFKKMVIADRAAVFVNEVFNNAYDVKSGWVVLIASVFFVLQIYGDFSGYTDIAIGSAKIMGIDLMTNFKQPLFSKSINEFWSRWHISLTSWFKDYIYIPLGGNKKGEAKKLLNVFIVFLISGLWHGANFTYIIWGASHGAWCVLETWTDSFRKSLRSRLGIHEDTISVQFLKIATTVSGFCLTMIIFRANSLVEALHLYGLIGNLKISGLITQSLNINASIFEYGINLYEMKLFLIMVVVLMGVDLIIYKAGSFEKAVESLYREPLVTRWLAYFLLIFSIMIFGVYGDDTIRQFIYFQF